MTANLTSRLKQQALQLGFVKAGVATARSPNRLQKLHSWLDCGFEADMNYFHTRRAAYEHPEHVLSGCKSILMMAMPYPPGSETEDVVSGQGKVARYARGDWDYHDVIHDQLTSLKKWLANEVPDAKARGVVDTAPLLEREVAEEAGLGWVGKNTLLLDRTLGSYFFLAALLTDIELDPDEPFEKGFCGTCTACLDACPTNAFPEPFVLNANRCISYLTIEHRECIEEGLAKDFSDWIFGCDICQEVCPWNRKVESYAPEYTPQYPVLSLSEQLTLDEDEFRSRFRKTPMWRAKRRGMIRNALILVANQRELNLLSAVEKLQNDPDDLIRKTASWVLKKLEHET